MHLAKEYFDKISCSGNDKTIGVVGLSLTYSFILPQVRVPYSFYIRETGDVKLSDLTAETWRTKLWLSLVNICALHIVKILFVLEESVTVFAMAIRSQIGVPV